MSLLTGTAGFIASHIIEELLNHKENSIIGIDNFYSGTKENLDYINDFKFQNIKDKINNI